MSAPFNPGKHPRNPAGSPAGGKFTESQNAGPDPDVTLHDTALPDTSPVPGVPDVTVGRKISNGVHSVIDTVRETDPERPNRVTFRAFRFPPGRAWSNMATRRLEYAVQPDVTAAKVDALARKRARATVLTRDRAGSVFTREGTLFKEGERVGMLNKGSTTKGVWLDTPAETVVHVAEGYGKADTLVNGLRWYTDDVPLLAGATFDDVPVWDGTGDPPSAIAAVYVMDHPGFDEGQDGRGSVFFATDFQPGDGSTGRGGAGLVNGYFVAPSGSGLVSEGGSFYVEDVKKWGGRVAHYPPGTHTFADAVAFGNAADNDDDVAKCWSSLRRTQMGLDPRIP